VTTADEREFLLRSIRDLDEERAAGDIDERDYVTLRDDYTARAAEALRGETAATPPPPARGGRTRLAIVAGIAVVAVAAGLLVAHSAGDRLPNEAATGSITSSTSDQLAAARRYIQDGKAVDAVKLYDRILRSDPKQPEALAYRGWLVRLAGLPDDGLTYIDRAIAADPTYPDARFFKGMILWKDKHEAAAAIAEFQAFLASNPPADAAAAVRDAMSQAQAEASGTQRP
jgi:tetratricopeptide (TPR) repeat protein